MAKTKFKQGKYIPINPEKYIGKIDNIFYRSSWEQRVFLYMDLSKNVLKWASEEIVINYIKPTDNKQHRYFPDIYAEVLTGSGAKKFLIEIKPKCDSEILKVKKVTAKSQQRVAESAVTMVINEAKWEAAKEWCRLNDITFMVWTEDEIFGKKS